MSAFKLNDSELSFTSLQEFSTLQENLTESEKQEICFQILETLKLQKINIETAKLYCDCLAKNQMKNILLELLENNLYLIELILQRIFQDFNVEILETFISFIPESKKYDILSMEYSKFKTDNSKRDDNDIFVQCYLISSKFYAVEIPKAPVQKNKNNKKTTERLDYLIELTEKLILTIPSSEMTSLFLFDLKQVVLNIFAMKNVLSSTKKFIPWLELEFYCIQFIKYFTEDNLPNLISFGIITPVKLKIYLSCFLAILKETKRNSNKIQKPAEFQQLIEDYNFIRDVESMYRIHEVVKVARSVDAKTNQGQIVIIRALQILGEHTKSTIETPKMSGSLERRLLRILPKNMLTLVQRIRLDVSHSASVRRSLSQKDFELLQQQLKFLGDAIRFAFFDYGRVFMNRIFEVIGTFNLEEDNLDLLQRHFERNSNSLKSVYKEMDYDVNSFLIHYDIKSFQTIDSYTFWPYLMNFVNIFFHTRNGNQNARDLLKSLTTFQLPNIQVENFIYFDELLMDLNYVNSNLDKKIGLIGVDFKYDTISKFSIKSTIEELANLLHGYTCQSFLRDKIVITAVEMILLELFCQLKDEKLLKDAYQWIDSPIPLLAGIPLRNHLAHYNVLVDILNIDQRIAIYQNAKSFIDQLNDKSPESHEQPTCFEPSYEIEEIRKTKEGLRNVFLEEHLKYGTSLNSELEFAKNLFEDTPLHIAASKGQNDVIKNLIQNGADTNAINFRGMTPLHIAVSCGHKNTIELLLQYEVHVDASKKLNNMTCLHLGVFDLEITKFLIAQGADINAISQAGSVLEFASGLHNEQIIQYLFEIGITHDQNHLDRCLLWAVMTGAKATIKVLLDHGANVNSIVQNVLQLNAAVMHNQLDIIKLLLDHKADINSIDNFKNTALHIAASNNYYDAALILIEHGAKINVRNEAGKYPLDYIYKRIDLNLVKLLFSPDLDIDWICFIEMAIERNSVEIVGFLLENLPNLNINELQGAIMNAANRDDSLQMIQFLIEKGIPLNFRKNWRFFNLDDLELMKMIFKHLKKPENSFIQCEENFYVWCCSTVILLNRRELTEEMLKYLDPSEIEEIVYTDQFIGTILEFCAHVGNAKAMKSVLEKGKHPQTEINNCLSLAIKNGHWTIIDLLFQKDLPNLEFKVDVIKKLLHFGHEQVAIKMLPKYFDKTIDTYNKYIHFAAFHGHLVLLKFLLSQKVDPRLSHSDFELNAKLDLEPLELEPIHLSVAAGNYEITNFFLSSKLTRNLFDVQERNELNLLHFAAAFNQIKIAEYLLELGFDIDKQDDVGNTCLHVASSCNHIDFVSMLLCKGAIYNLPNNNSCTPSQQLSTPQSIKDILLNINDLFEAVRNQNIGNIKIIDSMRLNAPDYQHGTVLHLAAKCGYYNIFLTLLQNGAQYNKTCKISGELINTLTKNEDIKKIFSNLDKLFKEESFLLFETYFNEIASNCSKAELNAYMFANNTAGHTILQEAIYKNFPNVQKIIQIYTKFINEEIIEPKMENFSYNSVNFTKYIIFADYITRHYKYSKNLKIIKSFEQVSINLIEICTKSTSLTLFTTNSQYILEAKLQLAGVQINFCKQNSAIGILNDVFRSIQNLVTILKIYKLAIIISLFPEGLFVKKARILCDKITESLLKDFKLSQKEIIYECLWHKSPKDVKGKKARDVEDLFAQFPTLDENTFNHCVRMVLLPTSAFKRDDNIISYYRQSFGLIFANLNILKYFKTFQIIPVLGFSKIAKGLISLSEFKLEKIVTVDTDVIKKVVLKDGFTEEQFKNDLKYILHDAVKAGNMHLLLKAIKYGANIERFDECKKTPLDYAISKGDTKMIEVLKKCT